MILILLVGAYFRFVGLNWGEYTYMHPDERFLVWVTADIAPVQSLSQYFDTATSTLNPNNRGHGFYVYGTLPVFITRYLVDLFTKTPGWEQISDLGRGLSALADLLTALLVYLAASRLYNRRVGVLAGAFYALAVLPIQLSHFYKEDTFLNFFTFLAIYFAIRIMVKEPRVENRDSELEMDRGKGERGKGFLLNPDVLLSIGFGLAFGCAMASKVNALPAAMMLPAAFLLRVLREPREEWEQRAAKVLPYLVLAGFVSILVFRVLQPYAFSGPSFFGVKLNPAWLANMQEQRNQATGDVDFPPALQWARRPKWFALENLSLWGLGLPLGVLAWAGFLWAGWRILKGDWQRHLLLWGWTAFYFIWQSIAFNPTMRYLLPIYPTLAIFAGWAVIALYDQGRRTLEESAVLHRLSSVASGRRARLLAGLVAGAVLGATLIWAIAFTGIYRRPFTRVEASRWVYQNVPGPINIHIQKEQGLYNEPLPYPAGTAIRSDLPFQTGFQAKASGTLTEIYLGHVASQQPSIQPATLSVGLSILPDSSEPSVTGTLVTDPAATVTPGGVDHLVTFDAPILIETGKTYTLIVQMTAGEQIVDVCGPVVAHIQTQGGQVDQSLTAPDQCILRAGQSIKLPFSPQTDGLFSNVTFTRALGLDTNPAPATLTATLSNPSVQGQLASGSIQVDLTLKEDPRGSGTLIKLDRPITVQEGDPFQLSLSISQGGGPVTLVGSSPAVESTWDDAIPLRLDGYDGYGGIYQGDLNFEMYWDDTPDKLERFIHNLDRADYVFITSSRQWGTTTRVPERYPLTTEYYRRLLGCPPERSVVWCYDVAQVGTFKGDLGYDLIQVFDSSPQFGPLRFNDQFAEEAFTVYDHPKVFIFRKAGSYDPQKTASILRSVDLSQAVHVTPRRAGSFPANLMLPPDRWNEQRAGGTWSQLFDWDALQNRFQGVGVAVWYLSVFLLGLIVYPLLRLALPGLADHGYPLARIAGLLLLSYLVWIGGSFRIPFTRLTISAVGIFLLLVCGILAYQQREELRREWRDRRLYFIVVEGLFLAFFLFDLAIRFGNPDLWHPAHGGEKPMDFSYFNAVLKSTSFPPYDPWFAGGYLNYYYYGFVLVGVLVKLLGIIPSVAYNLILPTIFSMIAMGAFSIVWNLISSMKGEGRNSAFSLHPSSFIPALGGALGLAVLGNLGTVRMIWRGYQMLAAPGGTLEGASVFLRLIWAVEGFFKVLAGASLPYYLGDWYWIPSRIMPPGDDAITEFPIFTILYGDPHAHLFALPITLLVLAFALSVVLSRARWRSLLAGALGFFLGGLAVGALRPTNTWDFYPYLPLASVAVGYGILAACCGVKERLLAYTSPPLLDRLPETSRRLLLAAGGVLLLAALSLALYQPYAHWYGQAYNKVQLWEGPHTPLGSYLTHWGLFLFLTVSWMAWETRDWMASTPVSALRKLDRYKALIQTLIGLLLIAILVLMLLFKVSIAWLVLPLMVWAGVLILRPGQSDARRFVLFLIGTALTLTLMVELVVLVGDIGRMNTVFKFYLVAWTLFAVSAGASLGWLMMDLQLWWPRWRAVWQVALAVLVFSAALYPILGGLAKVKNRFSPEAPHTLDGMAYMAYAEYQVDGQPMALDQDYRAIRWMQENVAGSPVIVEGNLRQLYQWGSRFSIYTGLPGVVGWEWHQQQQRALLPGERVTDRILEIDNFYLTTDLQQARAFLQKYDVRYIVVGLLERGHYPGPGLDKFSAANGALWRQVYSDGQTAIYEVNPQ